MSLRHWAPDEKLDRLIYLNMQERHWNPNLDCARDWNLRYWSIRCFWRKWYRRNTILSAFLDAWWLRREDNSNFHLELNWKSWLDRSRKTAFMGYYCRIFTRLHWKCRYRVGVLEAASFSKAVVLSVTQSRFCRFTRGSNITNTYSVFLESFRDIGCAVLECFVPVPGCDCFGASLRRSLAFSSRSS